MENVRLKQELWKEKRKTAGLQALGRVWNDDRVRAGDLVEVADDEMAVNSTASRYEMRREILAAIREHPQPTPCRLHRSVRSMLPTFICGLDF
jgi:hypothetical protein